MTGRCHRLGTLVAISALMSLVASSAIAQDDVAATDFEGAIHVVQPKPVLQKGRFDLSPRMGMTINDAVHRNIMVGATANYHFTERVYAGAVLQWFNFGGVLGGPTQNFRDLNAETRATVDAAYLNWSAGAEVGFVPLYGKFALLNRGIIFYDVSVTAGALFAESSSVSTPAASQAGPAGTVSLQGRFFLNRWMAVNLELRDVLFMGTLRGIDSAVLTHSVTLGLGMSFYLPTTFEYSDSSVAR